MHHRLLGWGTMLLLVGAVVACAGAGSQPQSRAGGPPPNFTAGDLFVSVVEVKQELDRKADFDLIDVRPAEDYRKSHISGARNIPFYDMEKRYIEVPKDKWVVLY